MENASLLQSWRRNWRETNNGLHNVPCEIAGTRQVKTKSIIQGHSDLEARKNKFLVIRSWVRIFHGELLAQ